MIDDYIRDRLNPVAQGRIIKEYIGPFLNRERTELYRVKRPDGVEYDIPVENAERWTLEDN